jgi:nicotinamidase-related amidase
MRTAADVPDFERVEDAALLVVDMQNDFVRQGAPLEVAEARTTIAPNRKLIDCFRALGRPVVYTRFLAEQSPGLMWLWSPQCGPETRCCWKGVTRRYEDRPDALDCVAVIDELAPEPGDLVIDKYGYGSFHATDLDTGLKALGVRSLVVTGTVAQICVEETAREAFHHGYRTVMVSDGVSSFDAGLKAATLKNFGMKFGWVADSDAVLEWVHGAAAGRARKAG